MADYVPLFLPGDTVTGYTTSATVTGGRAVKVSGDGTFANSGAAGDIIIGVASQDFASGDKGGYFGRGTVHRLIASGTVTAGDLVNSGASGQVVTLAAVTTPTAADVTNSRSVFGVALTTATTGNVVEIMEL